jgi:hypothetical protein
MSDEPKKAEPPFHRAGSFVAPGIRDRRYAIRYPFDAQAELLDLETGLRSSGTTTDISFGGCFVRASRPFPPSTRVRLWLTKNKKTVEVLARVRSVKPGIGMGVEFVDLDPAGYAVLQGWFEALRSR